MSKIFINARETEKRIMVVRNGEAELYGEFQNDGSLVGNIYIGIVEKVVPSMNAAFVNIGNGKKGFLHYQKIPNVYLKNKNIENPSINHFVSQGQKILVQVEKDETDTKTYRLTANLEIPGKTIVYLPFGGYIAVSKKMDSDMRANWKKWASEVIVKDEGILIRTLASVLKEEHVLEELNTLRKKSQEITSQVHQKAPKLLYERNQFLNRIITIIEKEKVNEIHCDELTLFKMLSDMYPHLSIHHYTNRENLFSHFHLNKFVDQIKKQIVWLSNGANIVIEETEACTIIDVNTGKFTSIRDKNTTTFETNQLAAIEIARQIRLRNISGIILIDFINMKKKDDQEKIKQLMEKEFKKDYERTIVYSFTSVGMLEITRKRTTPSLHQKNTIPCPICHGRGSVQSASSLAFQLERELWEFKGSEYNEVRIEATPDIIHYFSGEHKAHLKNLQESLYIKIHFTEIKNEIPHYHIIRLS